MVNLWAQSTAHAITERTATPEPERHSRSPQRMLCTLYVVACAAMVAPSIYYKYPLSLDYLNHLTRLYILRPPQDPFLGSIFGVKFGITPNLALDLIALIFRPFDIPPNIFLKSFFVVSAIGMWLGLLACHRAIHGEVRASAFLLLPLAYSFLVSYGFMDFVFGMAIFFFVFAWVISRQPKPLVLVPVVNIVSTMVFFSHFGAFLIMGLCLFLYRIGQGKTVTRSFVQSLAENAIPIGLYLLMPPLAGGLLNFSSLISKIAAVVAFFYMGSPVGTFISFVFFGAVLAMIYATSSVDIPPAWRPLVLGLGLAGMLAPFSYRASYYVDWRLMWTASIFALLTINIRVHRLWLEPIIVGAVVGSLIVAISGLLTATRLYNRDIAEFREAIKVIPSHSFVFISAENGYRCKTIESRPAVIDNRFHNFVGSFVTIDRKSLQPYIFANRGTEAVSLPFYYKERFSKYIAFPPQGPTDSFLAALLAVGSRIPLTWDDDKLSNGSVLDDSIRQFMVQWNKRFDYVIDLKNQCANPSVYASLFHEVARGSYFEIFKTDKTTARSASMER